MNEHRRDMGGQLNKTSVEPFLQIIIAFAGFRIFVNLLDDIHDMLKRIVRG